MAHRKSSPKRAKVVGANIAARELRRQTAHVGQKLPCVTGGAGPHVHSSNFPRGRSEDRRF